MCFSALGLRPRPRPRFRPWVGLDNGRVADYLWEVESDAPAGIGRAGGRPASLPAGRTVWELGPFNYRRSRFRACTGPAARLVAAEAPLVATSVQPSSGTTVDMTAVGMIFAPTVRRVQVTLSDGSLQTVHLEQLKRSQARSAHLDRFEFAAFAFRGLWCAERMVA